MGFSIGPFIIPQVIFMFATMLMFPQVMNARQLLSIAMTPDFAPAPSPATNLIGEVCKKSNINQTLCIATLQSIAGVTAAHDIKTLAEPVLQAAKEESIVVGAMFSAIQNSKDVNPEFKPSLELCAFDYNDAAIFFSSKGLGDVTKSLEVHYALDDSHNCDSELEKIRNVGGFGVINDLISDTIQKWKDLYPVANGVILYAEDVFKGKVVNDQGYGDDYIPDY